MASVCGLLSPIIGFTLVLSSIAMSPWFSWRHNALSDLGVGESSLIFNLGLILSGAFLSLYAFGLYSVDFRRPILGLGWLLLAFSGFSLGGIGVFPEDRGAIHFYFSVAFFTLLASSLLVIGFGMILYRRYRSAVFTLSIGVSAALVWMMPYEGAAIPEAISSILGSIWIIAVAVLYLRGPSLRKS